MGRISGCLTKLLLWGVAIGVFMWGVLVVLNPWALHIGGRSTPLLYWHGTGIVRAEGGKALPLYVSFWPDRPQGGGHGIGRREGKGVSARLDGTGWLCIAPRTVERMDLSGTMYGGYVSDTDSLLDFRLLEWKGFFVLSPPSRGFFDLAGTWHGPELVMDRPNQQGIPFKSGLFIHHALVTFKWANYEEFDAACNAAR
jgi:hypothetical protein